MRRFLVGQAICKPGSGVADDHLSRPTIARQFKRINGWF